MQHGLDVRTSSGSRCPLGVSLQVTLEVPNHRFVVGRRTPILLLALDERRTDVLHAAVAPDHLRQAFVIEALLHFCHSGVRGVDHGGDWVGPGHEGLGSLKQFALGRCG
jgi:hypothetical protein